MAQRIWSLYIINKSGGLIYDRDFIEKTSQEDPVRKGGLLYGMLLMSQDLAPVPDSGGFEVMECDAFRLHCFQTLTGTRFFMIADPNHQRVNKVLKQVYKLYSDYVLKNPFYLSEQPIRKSCEKFDTLLYDMIQKRNAKLKA